MTADGNARIRAQQQQHWTEVFAANPDMYGSEPSAAAVHAAQHFTTAGLRSVLELGAGQGRDTMYLAAEGFDVVALDYADEAVQAINIKAKEHMPGAVIALRHDVRDPLPFAADSFDASYSHMLLCMALTGAEIHHVVEELHRVVRPGGSLVYTVRHTGDSHYGTGIAHGDDMFENGGFIVHFFTDELVRQLADGFELVEVAPFTEGGLPRELWRVTMHKH